MIKFELNDNMKNIKSVLNKKKSLELGASIIAIFIGLLFLILSGVEVYKIPVGLMMSATFILIFGTYNVTSILSSVPDYLIFSLFKTFSGRSLEKRRHLYFQIALSFCFCLSSLVYAVYAENIGASVFGSFVFSIVFPFLVINLRYHKRKAIYQRLMEENNSESN